MESDDLTKGWEQCTLQEALDELDRECKVRERCFPKWVSEGRLSTSEARDRIKRLIKAGALLSGLQAAGEDTIPFSGPAAK